MTKEFYHQQLKIEHNMLNFLVESKFFSQNQFVLGDVGTRFGFDPAWDVFKDQCIMLGFEPDKEEYDRLKKKYSDHGTKILENIALWDEEGFQTLYVTRNQSASSCLKPNTSFFNRLPDPSLTEVVKTIQVSTTTLDQYCKQKNIELDVLKLDVQGGELNVLKGGRRQLEQSILAIVPEVHFVEEYINLPFFSEVDQYLRSLGFGLFDLELKRWRRKALPNMPENIKIGQTVYANALYLKDPIESGEFLNKKMQGYFSLLKLACLAEFFSIPDYAIELISYGEDNEIIETSLSKQLIKLIESNKPVSTI